MKNQSRKNKELLRNGTNFSQSPALEWEELCQHYLPVTAQDSSIWRLSRAPAVSDPEQGWKLHVSATVLSAGKILKKIAPYLSDIGALFKAPLSLQEVGRINCGLYYGFSQVGKIFTIYPKSSVETVTIARQLHNLTRGNPAPRVPFEPPFRPNSCIHYRYGAFSSMTLKDADGTCVPAIRDGAGKLIPDVRGAGVAVPVWTTDPFRKRRTPRREVAQSPLKTTIRAYQALSQRGRGGVYKALDFSRLPARLCILKEGRRHGETAWDGRDGRWRVRHEGRVLAVLSSLGVNVPSVYTSFEVEGHYYLVTEFIEGENLQAALMRRRKLSFKQAIDHGLQAAKLMDQIHGAGWVWRDCKPLNLMLSGEGVLRPLDFEGACPIEHLDIVPWGTHGYVPPEWQDQPLAGSRIPEDLYALGATLYHILCGQPPEPNQLLASMGKLRRRVSLRVREVIMSLLDPLPQARPSARIASEVLESVA